MAFEWLSVLFDNLDRFGSFLTSSGLYSAIFGLFSGPKLGHFGVILGRFWATLWAFWGNVVIVSASFWHHVCHRVVSF